MKEKIRNWINKNIKKINLVLGTEHNYEIQRSEKSIGEAFVKYLEILASEVAKSEKIEANFEKFDEN